jgi:hypothetical protein
MAIFRLVAVVPVLAAVLGLPALACDSNYPWLCTPVPSIDPPETAESDKPAAKPLPITPRAGRATKTSKSVRVERSTQVNHKRMARRSAARQWAVRARHAKIAAASAAAASAAAASAVARTAAAEAQKAGLSESARTVPAKPSEAGLRPAIPPTGVADDGNGPNTGFAAMWAEVPAERSRAEQAAADAPPTAEPAAGAAPLNAVPVVSQNEVNAIDLAAADPAAPADSTWLRGLVLALGGLIAVGSALRMFI